MMMMMMTLDADQFHLPANLKPWESENKIS